MVIVNKYEAWEIIKRDHPDMKEFIILLKEKFVDIEFYALQVKK